ncbi:tetratricopeptide repeat protein [Brumimicrobium glaciale]|uniref:Tetratricopeptide repeat protein n=1 Tax=Brumimicrobium glaciale TaxID=200475 RepID=A0A4Q4KQR6_9FLAO|nr:tetratricopeptide repeat protein [Brumimicrobium glaciale]RYM35737.1 tetratricopeptide repeat protein [Brumimicrobium glaciale]
MKFVFGFKCFLKLFIIIITLIDFSLVGQIPTEDSTDYFAKGLKAHEAGDYEKALKLYNKQLNTFPDDYRAYNDRGNLFVDQGEVEKGIQDYEKALYIDSSARLVRYNIGNLKFDEGLFGASIDYFKEEINVNPEYSSTYNNMGYAYFMLEEFDLAINSFEKAIQLVSSYNTAKINLEKAVEQKALNEKWKDKLAVYKNIVYDSSFNKLKELGFPSAYNRKFLFSSHFIYDNWDAYSGTALKFYESNNKLTHVINLKKGVENGYSLSFNYFKELEEISYTCQDENYRIEISYHLNNQYKLIPYWVRIKKNTTDSYYSISIRYKKRNLKVTENYNFSRLSLFSKRMKETNELSEFLKSKDYLSLEIIEQCATMGVFSRIGLNQEEIIEQAGFKTLLLRILEPFRF